MKRLTLGILIGLLLGSVVGTMAQLQLGNPVAPGSLSIKSIEPAYFSIVGSGEQEVLGISRNGEVHYKGRLLGTDKEVWWGIQTVFAPGVWCEKWEASKP